MDWIAHVIWFVIMVIAFLIGYGQPLKHRHDWRYFIKEGTNLVVRICYKCSKAQKFTYRSNLHNKPEWIDCPMIPWRDLISSGASISSRLGDY